MSNSALITSQLIYEMQHNSWALGERERKIQRERQQEMRSLFICYRGSARGRNLDIKTSRISISVINYGCCLMSPNCCEALRGSYQRQKSWTYNVEPSPLNVSSSTGSAVQKHGSWTGAAVVKHYWKISTLFIVCICFTL